jgi:hypothetical protein
MSDEFRRYRAIALGAWALAVIVGASPASPLSEPAPEPPIAAVLPEERRLTFPAIDAFSHLEPSDWELAPAGPEPLGTFQVKMSGPDFEAHVPVIASPRLIWLMDIGTEPPPDAAGNGQTISIRYREPGAAAPYQTTAESAELEGRIRTLVPLPIDLKTLGITHIEVAGTEAPVKGEAKPAEAKSAWPELLAITASLLEIFNAVVEMRKTRMGKAAKPEALNAKANYRKEGDAVVTNDASGSRQVVLSLDDIGRADDSAQRLIESLNESVQLHFRQYSDIYPLRGTSDDPAANAQIAARLDALERLFCIDLTRLRKFVESTGRALGGFEGVDAVCQGF